MRPEYLIEFHPLRFEKSASESTIDLSARQECEQIMSRIYGERPDYWPYGLSIPHHNGGVYMIRKASTNEAVGFVGWQSRREGLKKVGYYSIGVLPEHRGQGLAGKAVRAIIAEKAATVDQVKAFIMPHNKPSLGLAARLGVPVTFDA